MDFAEVLIIVKHPSLTITYRSTEKIEGAFFTGIYDSRK